jgi:hypothetical protein
MLRFCLGRNYFKIVIYYNNLNVFGIFILFIFIMYIYIKTVKDLTIWHCLWPASLLESTFFLKKKDINAFDRKVKM